MAESNTTQQSFLIVDDDNMLRTRLARAMESRGYRALPAANYDEVIDILRHEKPDLASIDLNMPGESGIEVLKTLKEKSPHTRAVIVTGFGSIPSAVEAVQLGAIDYLNKPTDADQILATLLGEEVINNDDDNDDAASFRPQTLAESEWEHIHRVLTDCGDNISEAARQLGIPRRTLQRKLKKRAP